MTISVIMPVFNGEKYICEAIQSILRQGALISEIVVVDDGSTDRSMELAGSFAKVKVISQQNQGIGPARNSGIRYSTCDYLAFLDADDVWRDNKTEWQFNLLSTASHLDAVLGHVEQFNEDGSEPEGSNHFGVAGTMLIRRSAFMKVGWFSGQHRVGEFIEWYARAIDAGLNMTILPQLVLKRRIHGENTTLRELKARQGYLRMIRDTVKRRRLQQVSV